MQSIQPTGQTRYKNVRFGHNGNKTYTQKNLIANWNINAVTVGTIGLPMPRNDANITSWIPQMK